jgi:uncharacterized protein (DUF302 family)
MLIDEKRGIIQLRSPHSFVDTFARLESAVESRGIRIFATIDFSGNAEGTGLDLNPTKMLVFGNPKSGTPIMQAAPTIALDLPLKVLVSEDAKGDVWLSYNSLEYLRSRHDVPEGLLANISGVESIVKSAIA